jgi:hypothetical protein
VNKFARLGPVVQHTGEIERDALPVELMTFGLPRWSLALPGLALAVDVLEGTSRLRHLAEAIRVVPHGTVRVERCGNEVLFRADAATRPS